MVAKVSVQDLAEGYSKLEEQKAVIQKLAAAFSRSYESGVNQDAIETIFGCSSRELAATTSMLLDLYNVELSSAKETLLKVMVDIPPTLKVLMLATKSS